MINWAYDEIKKQKKFQFQNRYSKQNKPRPMDLTEEQKT